MAKKSSRSQQKGKQNRFGQPNLPFHSPSITKAEKAEISAKLLAKDSQLAYFNDVISEDDWLKVRYDHDNGVWLVMHTFTRSEDDTPIGIVTYRATRLENALASAIWKAGELSEGDFVFEGDDDW